MLIFSLNSCVNFFAAFFFSKRKVLSGIISGKPGKPEDPIVEHVGDDCLKDGKRLYQVKIGMGFLELPQVELDHGLLHQVEFL